jgi:zinc/manganese transport system substrate-binding protein/manganese/iron transport system substrate-binding protein
MVMGSGAVARFVGGVVISVTAMGALTGCSTAHRSDFRVVTTTTQVTDFTQNVMGESGVVYPLLQANQSAHTFDPSARDLLELSGADALVINGEGLEPWVEDAIAAAGFDGTIIDASEPVKPQTRDGVIDPHVWTDPANAAKMTQFISQQLGVLNPKEASTYARNATAFVSQLDTLNGWILETVDLVPAEQRLLVTNHDAFTYFVSAYDITLVGSIIPEFDDNAEPSAADIDALIAKIARTGAGAIFAESSISPKLAETIAAESGIRVFAGDDSLYSDTLGAPGSGANSYISATIHNVKLLAQSWGVAAPPVPKEIANA